MIRDKNKFITSILTVGITIMICMSITTSCFAAGTQLIKSSPIASVSNSTGYDINSIDQYKLIRCWSSNYYLTGKDSKLPNGIYLVRNSKLLQIYRSCTYFMNYQHFGYSPIYFLQLGDSKGIFMINSVTNKITDLHKLGYYGFQDFSTGKNILVGITDFKSVGIYSNIDGAKVCEIPYNKGYRFFRKIGEKIVYLSTNNSSNEIPRYKLYDLQSKKTEPVGILFETTEDEPLFLLNTYTYNRNMPQLFYILNNNLECYNTTNGKEKILLRLQKGDTVENFFRGSDMTDFNSSSTNNSGSFTSVFIVKSAKQKRVYYFDINTCKVRLILTEPVKFDYMSEAISNNYLLLDKDGNHHLILDISNGKMIYMHMVSNRRSGSSPITGRLIIGINDITGKLLIINTKTDKYCEFTAEEAPVSNKNFSLVYCYTSEPSNNENATDISIRFKNNIEDNFYTMHLNSVEMKVASETTDK